MVRDGLFIGSVAKRTGVSRKALRLYEAHGILPPCRRTAAGYRLYDDATIGFLEFVRRAQRLGFTLEEIKEIVAIRRAGRVPCNHVRDLVRRKSRELDERLGDLLEMRKSVRRLLNGWRSGPRGRAVVCPHIESVQHVDKTARRRARRTTREVTTQWST